MKKFFFAATVATFASVAHAGPLGPYDDLLVFGDSLSDPGNAFFASGGSNPNRTELPDGSIAYPRGMWSDNEVWAVKLGADALSGRNFAFGGARAGSDDPRLPDLIEQTAFYSPSGDPDYNPITALFAGGNDFLKLLNDNDGETNDPTEKFLNLVAFFFTPEGKITDEGSAAIADTYARTISGILGTPGTETEPAIPGAVQLLADKKLTDFVIFGLPDLGRQPGLPSFFAEFLSGVAVGYNMMLANAVKELNDATPGLNLSFFDVAAAIAPLFDDPNLVSNRPCVLKDADDNVVSVCADPSAFLLYDTVHPTDLVHQAVAEAFTAHVTPIPLPAGAPLLLVGLAALGVASRRRVAGRSD